MSEQAKPPPTDVAAEDFPVAADERPGLSSQVALLSAHPAADALAAMLRRLATSEGARWSVVEDAARADLCLVTDAESLSRLPDGRGAVALCLDLDVRFVDPSRFVGAVVPLPVHRSSLVTAGFVPSQVRVAFVGAPLVWSDAAEPSPSALSEGLLAEDQSVVVLSAEVASEGMALWLQLSLVSSRTAFFIDVGADESLAAALRKNLPTLSIDAFLMSSEDPASHAVYRAASVVVCRVFDPSMLTALSCGKHALVAPPSLREQPLLSSLIASGHAESITAYSTLAVQLDALLGGVGAESASTLETAALAQPAQLVEAVDHFVAQRRGGRAAVRGLERVASADGASRPPGMPMEASVGPDSSDPHSPTPGAANVDPVDAELAALRAKLGL